MQHIIKKQIIDLSLSKGLDAFHIQKRVSDYYFAKIVPLLQDAFDAASTDEETISIYNLIIDLGMITEKEIEKGNWEEKVFKNITEQLIPVKHGISSGVKVKKKTNALSISGQWIFYMQHGYLPWNVFQINQDWYDKVLQSFASDAVAINDLKNLINRHPDSVRRIVFQNSIPFLKSLIETLTAENQDALPEFINEIIEIISSDDKNKKYFSSKQKKEAKQKLWEEVLQLAASSERKLKSSPASYRDFVLPLSDHLSTQQLNSKKVKQFLLKNKIDAASLKQIIKEKGYKEKESIKEEISTKELIKKEDGIKTDEDGIYVSNAGIVLLHPFLNQLFKNLHLVQEGNFTHVFSQIKALYLLHYLAAGNTSPEEHELVIAKVLCAFPLEKPVDNLIEFTKEELQEADNVLTSAIGQWEILKSTSPDGFREGFLQRNGKLLTKNGAPYLQIEQSSIDMLLDHLPWNLSMIQLPWMEDILKVEWR